MADRSGEACWGGFEELGAVQVRARATSPLVDRIVWVETMLRIAEQSGALARLRRRKHEAILLAFGVVMREDADHESPR
jgi:hypothetical protein